MNCCRYCRYYKNKPHTIIWEFTEETQHYDGICINADIDTPHTNAGDHCHLFRKKVVIGPVLGAYNKEVAKND